MVATVLRAVVHQAWSSFGEDHGYLIGLALGSGAAWLLGLVVGLPIVSKSSRWVAYLLTALILLGFSAAAHYHAVFNRLPTGHTISTSFLTSKDLGTSFSANAPLLWATAEVLLGLLMIRLVYPRLAKLFESAARNGVWRTVLITGLLAWVALGIHQQFNASTPHHQGALSPLKAALEGWDPFSNTEVAARTAPNTSTLTRLQGAMAVPDATPSDARYPYCRPDTGSAVEKKPNIILLILEGIDSRDAALPQMPNLQRIANEGVSFDNFFASGAHSSQAMVSIFSGIPPETHRRILSHAPLHTLEGFPADLKRNGYETAYFHGSDLSFEQQRAYLTMVGFEKIIEPHPLKDKRLGWGLPDHVMFERLRDWIETRDNDRPFLAILFTISTHDPYIIPSSEPQAKNDDRFSKLAASLAYLDRELGKFYEWYKRDELSKNTILVITGDHSSHTPHPADPPITSTGELEGRFNVPFIVVGSDRTPASTSIPGGHFDIPTTVLGMLGWQRRGCYQGRDLFETGPVGRLIPSIAGGQLQLFFVHDGPYRWMVDFSQKVTSVFNRTADPGFENDLIASMSSRRPMIEAFARDYLKTGAYLNKNGYFAPPAKRLKRDPISGTNDPIVVSHRGNTLGPNAKNAPAENSLEAVRKAVEEGWSWVEIDLQVTKEGEIVLAHDNTINGISVAAFTLKELQEKNVNLSTLHTVLEAYGDSIGFCLEIKSQPSIGDEIALREGLLKLLPKAKHAIVDSFNRVAVQSIATYSDVEVGFDLPQGKIKREWLEFASERDFDWVYVRYDFATSATIELAHELGLKVMAYTVNEGDAPPGVDGVITDGSSELRARVLSN